MNEVSMFLEKPVETRSLIKIRLQDMCSLQLYSIFSGISSLLSNSASWKKRDGRLDTFVQRFAFQIASLTGVFICRLYGSHVNLAPSWLDNPIGSAGLAARTHRLGALDCSEIFTPRTKFHGITSFQHSN